MGGPHEKKMTLKYSLAEAMESGCRLVRRYSVAVAPNTDTLAVRQTKQQENHKSCMGRREQRGSTCHEGHEHGHAEPAYAPSPFRASHAGVLTKRHCGSHNLAAA